MNLDLVENNTDIRRHELIGDMAEQAAQFLIDKHDMEADKAQDVGNALADFLCEHWKGQHIYFVADMQYRLSQRDLMIFERMARGNAQDLARELGISTVRVYQIHKRVLAALRKRQQPSLFGDSESELSTGQNGKPELERTSD